MGDRVKSGAPSAQADHYLALPEIMPPEISPTRMDSVWRDASSRLKARVSRDNDRRTGIGHGGDSTEPGETHR